MVARGWLPVPAAPMCPLLPTCSLAKTMCACSVNERSVQRQSARASLPRAAITWNQVQWAHLTHQTGLWRHRTGNGVQSDELHPARACLRCQDSMPLHANLSDPVWPKFFVRWKTKNGGNGEKRKKSEILARSHGDVNSRLLEIPHRSY